MKKVVLGLVMLLTGLLGLYFTACGVMFLPYGGLGLIGIVLGGMALWSVVAMWKSGFGSKSSPSETPVEDDAQSR